MNNIKTSKFSADRLLTAASEWVLRLFTVPTELLLRTEVGERYCGVSGLLGFFLLWVWAWWSSSDGSGLLYLLLVACIVRAVVVRVLCVRRRQQGQPIHSRSAGRSYLEGLIPLPESIVRWIEPLALLVFAVILGFFSGPIGEYLEFAAVALLLLTGLRTLASQNQTLDAIDEQIEQNLPVARVIDVRTEPQKPLLGGMQSDNFPDDLPQPMFPPQIIPPAFLPGKGLEAVGGELSS